MVNGEKYGTACALNSFIHHVEVLGNQPTTEQHQYQHLKDSKGPVLYPSSSVTIDSQGQHERIKEDAKIQARVIPKLEE